MITIERNTLRAALKVCRSPERPHHPDYGLITISRAPACTVHFEAADDDWRVRLRVPAAAPSFEGALSVDSTDLAYIADGMGKLMELVPSPYGEMIEVSAAPLTAKLRTHAAPGEHTPIKMLKDGGSFIGAPQAVADAHELANALELVNQGASREETRYYIGGVYIQAIRDGGGGIGLTATNGHMLIHRPISGQIEASWRGCIVPRWCMDRIVAFLRLLPKGDLVTLREGDTALRIDTFRGSSMDVAPIDGAFPEWNRVVPPERNPWTFRIDVPQFQAACRRLVRGRRRSGARTLSWGGLIEMDQQELTLHAPLRTGRDREVSLIYAGCLLLNGPRRRIIRGVNLNYLRLLCEMLEGAATARVCSPSQDIGITFRADNGALAVLMPMKPILDDFNLTGAWE